MNSIGLRKEEKAFETRVAIVPEHVKTMAKKHKVKFILEPSDQRAFTAKEYESAGAKVKPLKGSGTPVVLGIKEMPIDFFESGIVYIFFSHTIKGQKYNMPMLQKILDVGATLIDYERVIDKNGRRVIYFGNWAGMAGISDTFRTFGQRLENQGVKPNPFAGMKPTLECTNLEELEEEFRKLGERIKKEGLPESMTPFVVGFAGYGNVSRGAQKMFDILPYKEITPENLPDLPKESNLLYKCVFKEEHMVEPKDTMAEFDLQDYYKYGAAKYKPIFHRYAPYLTIVLNCIYWSGKYPRLLTKSFMKEYWTDENSRLQAVGDISCDVGGAIEFTLQTTDPGNPTFSYIVSEDSAKIGVDGEGPLVMAVDNLPCELPRESSTSFSETLLHYIPALAKADFTVSYEKLDLPKELKDAVIVYQGKLTPNYEYLKTYL
jgi:alpha-aminoadipic semialdehyde synthase